MPKLFKLLINVSILSAGFLFAGCAHHRDVRPGADGVHRVLIHTDNQEEAGRDALRQANHFCEQQGKFAGIVDEKNNYVGSMKEQDYKNAKTAAKVAQAVGGAGWVFGGRNESTVGGVVGLGGGIADAALGKGYTVEMRFKCQ